jgi:hypothetical protein
MHSDRREFQRARQIENRKGRATILRTTTEAKGTTEVGYVNPNGQVVIRNTGKHGTDHNQKVYQLSCSNCGYVYGSNGSDIFDRKCPKLECGGGKAGLSF